MGLPEKKQTFEEMIGVHEMPEKQYRSAPGMNKSSLDILHRSPLHYITEKNNPKPPTPAMIVGSAFHMLVLEPEEFDKCCIKDEHPGSYSAKAKLWRAEEQAKGKIIINTKANEDAGIWGRSDWDNLHYMRDAVMAHPIASLLIQGDIERSLFWVDQNTKKLCKGKVDVINTDHELLVDLKSTADASYSGFAHSIHEYRYFVQDAFYFDGAWDCHLNPRGFVFVCVEKAPPYAVACYKISREWQQVGREVYTRDLEIYKRCLDNKEWPGYAPEVREEAMPGYAKFHKIS